MDASTISLLVSALESVGLGNLIVVLALVWGYRVMSKSAGAIGSFLKDALVTVGKLADKGIDIRLAVKLVDEHGSCVVPPDWTAAPSWSQEPPAAEKPRSMPPRSLNEPSGTWTQQGMTEAAVPAK